MVASRKPHQLRHRIVSLCLVFTLLALGATGAAAQTAELEGKIVIGFAPQWSMPELLTESFFYPFEEEFPNVDVVVVDPPDHLFISRGAEIQATDFLEAYASVADVFAVGPNMLTPIDTRAGLVLDLQPFIDADEDLDMTQTFYPKVRDAYNWDDGTWAMPGSWSLALMGYFETAFDKANLPYPEPDWSWETFAETMAALEAATGSPPLAAPYYLNPAYVVSSLAGVPLVDEDMMPQFEQEALSEAMEVWRNSQDASWRVSDDDYNYNESYPVVISDIHLSTLGNYRVYEHTTLPGGHTILQTEGFALSSGATHPEIAYELTKFLTRQFDLVVNYSSKLPARNDIYDQAVGRYYSSDVDVIRRDLENLLPYALHPSETVYLHYLPVGVFAEAPDDGEDQPSAQERVLDYLAKAAEYEAEIVIDKPESDFATVVGATVNFGLTGDTFGLNEKPLRDFAAEYADQRPDIGKIKIRSWSASPNLLVEEFDCFYGGERQLREMPISAIVRLESSIAGASDIERGSFIPAVLEQAVYQDVLWALPISLHPLALRYNPAAFAERDLEPPELDWDAAEFERLLRTLRDTGEESEPVLVPRLVWGSQYLELLIESYGGQTFDYAKMPVSFNFDSPETVDAIRKVLDLAREDLVQYIPSDRLNSSYRPVEDPIMMVDSISTTIDPKFNDYALVGFPRSESAAPLDYSIGLGFISAETSHQQACFDWISALTQRPDLFRGLPTRTDLVDSDTVTGAIAANGPAYFADFVTWLRGEDEVGYDELEFWASERRWLNQAYDSYVLDDVPLEDALAVADAKLASYHECIGGGSVTRGYECAEKVDRESDD